MQKLLSSQNPVDLAPDIESQQGDQADPHHEKQEADPQAVKQWHKFFFDKASHDPNQPWKWGKKPAVPDYHP